MADKQISSNDKNQLGIFLLSTCTQISFWLASLEPGGGKGVILITHYADLTARQPSPSVSLYLIRSLNADLLYEVYTVHYILYLSDEPPDHHHELIHPPLQHNNK